jgi:hypothetical protein
LKCPSAREAAAGTSQVAAASLNGSANSAHNEHKLKKPEISGNNQGHSWFIQPPTSFLPGLFSPSLVVFTFRG